MKNGNTSLSDQTRPEFANDFLVPGMANSDAASSQTLRESVKRALESYFEHLDGQMVTDLYELFLSEVEAPLLECVLSHTGNNQSRTATLLGLNRGTLRKKLKKYGYL